MLNNNQQTPQLPQVFIFSNTCTNFHQKHPQSQLFGFTMGSAHHAIKSNHLINEIIPFLSLLLHILINWSQKSNGKSQCTAEEKFTHVQKSTRLPLIILYNINITKDSLA
jgi:uncharacterized membrane protein